MDYFLMKQYEEIKYNAEIKFDFLKRKEIWREEEPLFFSQNNTEEKIYLPFMDCGICVVSKEVKKIFDAYQKGIQSRPIIIADNNMKKSDIFYAVKVREIDCLGNSTIYKNKTVQKIYLDSTKVVYQKVFQIKGISDRHIVVDLEVMEKLLRENIIAFHAELLEQEGSEIIWEKNML